MKNIIIKILLWIFFCSIMFWVLGCEPVCDHDCQVQKEIKTMKPPLTLVAKSCSSWAGCNAMIRDGRDSILVAGNLSVIGRMIGDSYNVGDTIILK